MGTRSVTRDAPWERAATITRFVSAMSSSIVHNGDLDGLAALQGLSAVVNKSLHETVFQLRSQYNYSWSDIGNALGITRAAACNRFGDVVGYRLASDSEKS